MIIAIIGEPATGKTTLMKQLMSQLGRFNYTERPFAYHYNQKIAVLGKYGGGGVFQGTDRLSMAVQPKVLEFIARPENKDKIILFEGDRIGNASFFDEAAKHHKVHIFELRCDERLKEVRHIVRGDKQSDKFKKAKKTKIENLNKKFNPIVLQNNDYKQMALNKKAIFDKIYRK